MKNHDYILSYHDSKYGSTVANIKVSKFDKTLNKYVVKSVYKKFNEIQELAILMPIYEQLLLITVIQEDFTSIYEEIFSEYTLRVGFIPDNYAELIISYCKMKEILLSNYVSSKIKLVEFISKIEQLQFCTLFMEEKLDELKQRMDSISTIYEL